MLDSGFEKTRACPNTTKRIVTAFANPESRIPNPGYSMFCTCSRIWSISTFSSTAMLLVRASTDFRSEEHTSELQSLMRISYAVFCLKKKNTTNNRQQLKQQSTVNTK